MHLDLFGMQLMLIILEHLLIFQIFGVTVKKYWQFLLTTILLIMTAYGREYPNRTGKCIRQFAGIYAYCRYFIDRKW